MKWTSWLRWIRLPNLIVVAITQYALFLLFVRPVLIHNGLTPRFDLASFHLLVLITVIITAGGYIINDILDKNIDHINHPNRQGIIQTLGVKHTRLIYYAISLIGFILSGIVAFRTDYLFCIWIYPVAVALLYLYSTHLKHRPLSGNILVSLFCGGVAYLILFIEHINVDQLTEINLADYNFLTYLILFYCGYAFLSNYIRELIKDAEDIEGDQANGTQTFPIKFGLSKTHLFITVLSILLILLLFKWMAQDAVVINMANAFYLILTIIFPVLYINMAIYRKDRNYTQLSLMSKLIMLAGLINLLFYQSLV